jgi:16S rRNA G1207 methylase RsmC
LDEGTRCLIRHLDGLDASPRAIIDLGAGVGPLGLWAAQRWPRARIFAVESNFMAAHLARTNAEGAGFSARYRVVESDGLPGVLPDGWSGPPIGGFDLAVCNPPTHADARELRALLEPLGSWLAAGAPAHFVVSRSALLERVLVQLGATFELSPYERYAIVRAVFPVGPGLPRRGSPRGAAATEVGPQRR